MTKKLFSRVFALLYIGAISASMVIMFKAGASIFYYKNTIDPQSIQPDLGYAYRFRLAENLSFFRSQDVLLFEDGRQLYSASGNDVIGTGQGAFSMSDASLQDVYIYFSASDNTDPITNGRKYTYYLPYNFISRPLGVAYLTLLLGGAAWFLYYALAIPDHHKTALRSPGGILTILDQFLGDIYQDFTKAIKPNEQNRKTETDFWRKLSTITILAAYLYPFMEWIFFVTKPSFMSIMSFFEQVKVFLLSGLFLSVMCLILIAVCAGISLVMVRFLGIKIARYLGAAIPTTILAALALLLIDNFTYTVFKLGISTVTGTWRGIYAPIFVWMWALIYLQVLKSSGVTGNDIQGEGASKRPFYVAMGIVLFSCALAVASFDFGRLSASAVTPEAQEGNRQPDIILLGGDGLSADRLSVYGYERDTTPRLRELAQGSLVAENAFPNEGNSAGSVVSMMTSKLSIETGVGYATDILTGMDAYQHLPGMLKSHGYETVEFGVPYYVDAYNFNMLNAFDWVNNRSQKDGIFGGIMRKLGFDNQAYFLDTLTMRISERLLHIFFIREMKNPYLLVTKPADRISDEEKVEEALSMMDKSEAPLFIHIHLMSTHGDTMTSAEQAEQEELVSGLEWSGDAYEEAIYTYDHHVGQVIDHLKASGEFENTLLIIYSDHYRNWMVNNRIPLIIHFPQEEHAGKISVNVQNMDIAPTILDYLGLTKPEWMRGDSLLDKNLSNHRLIFSIQTINPTITDESGKEIINPSLFLQPFTKFYAINIIDCQEWYKLDLKNYKLTSGDLPDYSDPCSAESLMRAEDILNTMINELALDGFDVSYFSKVPIDLP